MKNLFKFMIIASAMVSLAFAAVEVISGEFKHAPVRLIATVWLMYLAGALGAAYCLIKFSKQVALKIDHPTKKRADGSPMHRGWPLWLFLGFFLVEVALGSACIYFGSHMWCVRDLINFELTAVISAVVAYWFTHCLWKKA